MPYTIAQAAQRLGVSRDTIRRRIKSGELPAQLVGGRYAIDLTAVEERATMSAVTEVAILRERIDGLERERAVLLAELEARRRNADAADAERAELRRLLEEAQRARD